MPTEQKIKAVEEIRIWIEQCSIVISTDYTGMSVGMMTDFRRKLRENGLQFHVVKNRLAYLAADAANRPEIKDVITGPTGIALGYGDPAQSAKVISEFIKDFKAPLKIRGGVIGEEVLPPELVEQLATLPSREELISRLLGQLEVPVYRLVNVLNSPISGLARVLRGYADRQNE